MSGQGVDGLLARLREDETLLHKLLAAADLDAAQVIAQEADFVVSKADLLRLQQVSEIELSDEELSGVSGGKEDFPGAYGKPPNM